ncbi:hypothetical protein [Numidum massiliense]|uniref:hypothetical protein n=1 Tax=Numidum massiliense TaxID=1522315 RepID=UPI0006D575FD|nr:hypothetical protein [Numidum massiliense]
MTGKKWMVVVLAISIVLLSGCQFIFGNDQAQVLFTVLDASEADVDQVTPQAKIVNIGDKAIDILISGDTLKYGSYPLLVSNVQANSKEIQIELDWEKSNHNEGEQTESLHKMVRIEKGSWWKDKRLPQVTLRNVNGGELMASSSSDHVRQAAYKALPNLKNKKVYLKFYFENLTASDPKGVWDVTVVGKTEKEQGEPLHVVAKLKITDRDLSVDAGEVSYRSPQSGAIVKVEQLNE